MSGLVSMTENEKKERAQFLSRAAEPLEKIAFIRLFSIIVAALVLLLTFVMFIQLMSYSDSTTSYNLMNIFVFLLGIVNIILTIIFMVKLNELSEYESRFKTAMIFMIIAIVSDFFSNCVSSPAFAIFLSIASCILSIVFIYHFYGALADITADQNNFLSDRWDLLFKVYIGVSIVAAILSVIGLANSNSWDTIELGYICILIAAFLEIILLIIEFNLLRKTVNFFEELGGDIQPQGRFDDSEYNPQQYFSNNGKDF